MHIYYIFIIISLHYIDHILYNDVKYYLKLKLFNFLIYENVKW
jgi:hypothetical protein